MREYQLASERASRAEARARAPRSEASPRAPTPGPIAARVASIVHRIHRREGDAPLTRARRRGWINRGLKRLGIEALAPGALRS